MSPKSSATAAVHSFFHPSQPAEPAQPGLLAHDRERAKVRENRVADSITAFAGSMKFVYVHIVWFACWIGFGVESYPYGLLTMIVSLEAIFLSTFVLISQNRADAKRQVIADEQWKLVQKESRQNVELIRLSNEILGLTKEVRNLATARSRGSALAEPRRIVNRKDTTRRRRP